MSREQMSWRELEVIGCILARKTKVSEIAGELGLSNFTIEDYLGSIYKKLNVSGKEELLLFLMRDQELHMKSCEAYKLFKKYSKKAEPAPKN